MKKLDVIIRMFHQLIVMVLQVFVQLIFNMFVAVS